jgi:glycosyltransferase 2 family protein
MDVTLARLKRLLPFLGVLAFALASLLVWRSVRAYGIAGMIDAVRHIPPPALLLALLGTAASYGALTLCDWLGVRYAGRRVDWPRAALASFVSLSIGHSLGLAPLGSGALRARYYGRWGLDAEAIGKVILFCAATVTLGQIGLAGIVLLVDPDPPAAWLHAGDAAIRGVGAACLLSIAAYLAAASSLTAELGIGRVRLRLPRLRIAAPQVAAGVANFACLTLVLYVLLASVQDVPFWTVAAIYVLASVAALVSHVPGGLGIIEFVVLSFLPTAGTWGALIVFRAVYYILPLALGGLVLAADELLTRAAASSAPARGRVRGP